MSDPAYRSAGFHKVSEEPVQGCSRYSEWASALRTVGKRGNAVRKIVVKDYAKNKDELDEFCRRVCCGYEIRHDGSAVIIID
jgi:hypothetical protein